MAAKIGQYHQRLDRRDTFKSAVDVLQKYRACFGGDRERNRERNRESTRLNEDYEEYGRRKRR